MYGVALASLGMLGTLSTCLAIDVYGPICDNAGRVVTPGCQNGHVDHTGCHQSNPVLTAK
jgi:Na+/H+-translocating membrane pyrophosphatase